MENTLTGLTTAFILKSALRNLLSEIAIGSILLVFCSAVHAQKQATIPRIGILRAGAPSKDGASDAFLQGLRALGYVDRKNILFEIRYAEGNRERLRDLAIELVQLKVDAIYTGSSPAILLSSKRPRPSLS